MPQVVKGEVLDACPLDRRIESRLYSSESSALISKNPHPRQPPGHGLKHCHQFTVKRHKTPLLSLAIHWLQSDKPFLKVYAVPDKVQYLTLAHARTLSHFDKGLYVRRAMGQQQGIFIRA